MLCTKRFASPGETFTINEVPHTDHLHTTDIITKEKYGNDSKWLLRLKFINLSTLGHLLFPVHLITHIVDLFQGNFYHCGRETAERKFFIDTKTGIVVPIKDIVIESLKELAIRIAKIILLPLGFIAKDCCSLVGLLFPYYGRMCLTAVDQFFYVRPKDMFALSPITEFAYFSAPCMLTSQFRKRENIFRFMDDYRDDRSYRLEFKTILKNAPYLNLSLKIPDYCNWQQAIAILNQLINDYKSTRKLNEESLQNLQTTLSSGNAKNNSNPTDGGNGVTYVPPGAEEA